MVSVDTDEDIDYDDDFEEVSEEEGASRTLRGTQKLKLAAATVESAAAMPCGEPRPDSKDAPPQTPLQGEKRSGRRRPQDVASPDAARPLVSDGVYGAVPLSAPTATPTSGDRIVRGRVSVTPRQDADSRPGTGGSSHSRAGSAAGNAASKPSWLQFDSNVRRQPAAETAQQHAGDLRRSSLGDTPALGGTPPLGGSAISGERRRPQRSANCADVFGSEDQSGTADADRKVKRMQQTIDRLTQRVKEVELFSAEDDGIPTFRLDEVELGDQIAQGGFASVHHAKWRCTLCAIKKIFDPVITDELKADFENEVRMLRRLRHPNVVTLMAVCRVPPALSFLTEYVEGGSLFETLHVRGGKGAASSVCGPRDGGTLPHILRQTASALAYMHATEIVHRDVKSNNVLLCDNGPRPRAKLCDFGLARLKSELCTGVMQWAGTAPYMASELFEKRRYTEAVDVFAFGVMVWEAAAGDIPHANLEAVDIAERVRSKEYVGLAVPRSWPAPLRELLRATLGAKQEERPSMPEVIDQLQRTRDFPNPLEA